MNKDMGCGAPMVSQNRATWLPKIESDRNEFKKVDYQWNKEDLEEFSKLLKEHDFVIHETMHCFSFYKSDDMKLDFDEAIKIIKDNGFIVYDMKHCLAFYKEER